MLEQCGDYSKQKKIINIINNLKIAKQNGKYYKYLQAFNFLIILSLPAVHHNI